MIEKVHRATKFMKNVIALVMDKLLVLWAVALFYSLDCLEKIRHRRLKFTAKTASVLVSFCICLFVGVYTACHTGAVAVMVDGKTVGYVKDGKEANNTSELIYNLLQGGLDYADLEFKNSFVLNSELVSAEEVANKALNSMDGLQKKSGLYVDGMLTAVANSEAELQYMMTALAESYKVDGMEFSGA